VIADPDKVGKSGPIEVKEAITQEADIIKKVKMAKAAKTSKPTTAVSSNKPKFVEKALTENGLVELKNRTWVIQIGSFKNKANALRLVNQLRANGYPAFIQQLSGTKENTRVFVGPESKHKSAHALAQKLEAELHLKAIVISYQPLSL
jgi:DedD protein